MALDFVDLVLWGRRISSQQRARQTAVSRTMSGTYLRVGLDLLERLLPDIALDLPGGENVSLSEDLLNLLERPAGRLGEHEEDVDERSIVERAEDEVRLPRDGRQPGRHRPRKREVEHPVGGCRHRHGLGADAHREDFCRVRPRDGAHGDRVGADEEVGEDDDRLRDSVMARDDPHTVAVDIAPCAEAALEAANEEEPEAHQESASEEHRTATPLVDVDDGGNGQDHVENILHRVRNEVTAATGETGTLEYVDDIVPVVRSSVGRCHRKTGHRVRTS